MRVSSPLVFVVIPAQAGIHLAVEITKAVWIPACAEMTHQFI
jgi:hypothetical protein